MAEKDRELEAISAIIGLLTPLDEVQRSRVLEYVLRRLDMATVHATPPAGTVAPGVPSQAVAGRSVVDIRSLTAEKQPRSANEMVALIAYYLSELAPDSERSDTISPDSVRRYFKMAGFPLPRVLRNVLPNATSAGYLENVSRGEYRLNPVGYNLVVHGLPRSGSASPPPSGRGGRKRVPRR